MASPSEIYAKLISGCPPLEVRGPLGQYTLDPLAYAVPRDPAGLLNALLGEFSREDLSLAGVIGPTANPQDLPDLNPALVQSAFLAIRDSENGAPRHLVVESGCLETRCLPLVAAADDYRRKSAKGGCAICWYVAPSPTPPL